MKRVLSLLLSLFVAVALMPCQAFANESYNVFSADKTVVKAGEDVKVIVALPQISETAGSFTVNLKFDKEKFTVKEISKLSKLNVKNSDNEEDTVSITKNDVESANQSGELAANATYTLNTMQVSNVKVIEAKLTAKEAVGVANFSFSTFEITKSVDGSTVKIVDESKIKTPATIKIIKELTGTQAITGVTEPVKNATPVTTVTPPTNTTATIKWYSVEDGKDTEFSSDKFAGDTVYKAVINVKPADYYQFNNDYVELTVNGDSQNWEPTKLDDGSYNLTKTFAKTASKEISSIAITNAPNKTSYIEGQTFDKTGMVVTATYDDDSSAAVTNYTVEPSGELTTGTEKVTIKCGNKTIEQAITVVQKQIVSIAVTKNPTKMNYEIGDTADWDGMVVTAKYDNGKTGTLQSGEYSISGFNSAAYAESQEITVTASEKTAQFNVKIDKKTITAGSAFTYGAPSNLTYDGNAKAATATAKSPYDGAAVLKYKQAGKEVTPKDVGTYDVYVSAEATDTYKAIAETKLGSFNIVPKAVTDGMVAAITAVTYNGQNQTPTLAVTDGQTTLTSGTDFTYSYSNNKNAGTATVTITGKGNYTGTANKTFTINKAGDSTYDTTEAYTKQNVVVGVGSFVEPEFVSTFNEIVEGTYSFSYNGKATKEAIQNELAKLAKGTNDVSIGYTFTPAANGNYTGTKSGNIAVTMIDIEFQIDGAAATIDKAVTVKNGNPVYGTKWSDIISLNNNITAKVGNKEIKGTYALNVTGSDIPAAGSANYNIIFNSTDGQYKNVKVFTVDGTVTVAKKPLTVVGAKATDREYDNTTAVTVTGGTLNGVLEADKNAVTLGGTIAGTIANANAGNKKAVTVIGYAISGDKAANYELAQPTDVTVNIAKKALTLKSATVADKTFDGTTKGTVSVIAFKESDPLPTTEGYIATAAFADAKVGDAKDVTVKVVLNDTNYSLAENTITAKAKITKASLTIPTQKVVIKAGDKTEQTVDLSKLMPANAGELSYEECSETDSDNILQEIGISNDGKLSFMLTDNAVADKKETLSVEISSENYADATATVEVAVTSKEVPVVTMNDMTVTYTGEDVGMGMFKGTANVEGEFAWANGTTAPKTVASSGSYAVTFTPNDQTKYAGVTKTIKVTVVPAKVTGTLTFEKVTAAGKTLGDITPKEDELNKLSQSGTFAWNDGAAQAIEQGKTYGWTFTPSDANYEVLTGTITPWAASSYSGGGGGGGYVAPATPEKTAKNFITSNLTAGGKVFASATADNYKAILTAKDAYAKLSASEQAALDKELKAQTGKTLAELAAEAEAVKEELEKEPEQPAVTKAEVKATTFKVRSKAVTLNGKKAIKISWYVSEGELAKDDFDGFAIYRSTKKNSGYGKSAYYNTTKFTYTNSKGLKEGKTYYYKIRAYKYIDGVKTFTGYSTKAWRTMK